MGRLEAGMGRVLTSWVALSVTGALTACGGGGGGGGGGLVGPVTRTGSGFISSRSGPADFNAEAGRNYGLTMVGATNAQAAGRIGSGVKVAVIDTGIDLQHKDFEGAIDPASIDIISGVNANVDDEGGHGTSVAGVIGARRDGYDAVGVAPGSTILAVRSEASGSCASKCSFYYSDLSNATDYAVANGAQILNYSLGGSSISSEFQDSLAAAAGQGRILVGAAGNNGGTDPINPAQWMASAGAGGLGIAVGAVDSNRSPAYFTNLAGASKDFFLMAPGVSINTSANGGGTRSVNGTSFAAPHVAGAAAVVWGAAPYLTGSQVVDILLTSATDLGAAGTDAIYGRGLLNLDQALQPLGEMTVPTGGTVAQGGGALSTTRLSLGGAFGDAMDSAEALNQAMFLDGYGRSYQTDLSGAVERQKPGSAFLEGWLSESSRPVASGSFGQGLSLSVAAPEERHFGDIRATPGETPAEPRFALSAEMGDTRLGVAKGFGLDRTTGLAATSPEVDAPFLTSQPLSSPWLALAGDGTGMTAGRDLGDGLAVTFGVTEDKGEALPGVETRPERRAALAEAAKRWEDGTAIGLQLGRLSESAGPMGSSGEGAFGFGEGADTVFVGLFGTLPLSQRLALFGRMGLGSTDGDSLEGGLLRGASTIRSQSYALGGVMKDALSDGDSLALAVSRPLRVTSGSATLDVPVGRTMDGTILYRGETVDLKPSGAETDFELTWSKPLSRTERFVLGGAVMLQPGHVADAPAGFAAGAKYKLTW